MRTAENRSPLKPKEILVTPEKTELFSSKDYASILTDLRKQIQENQVKAITAANKELIALYWVMGRTIVERQEKSGCGTNFIEKPAHDLQNSFPGIEGFSRSNILRMRAFYNLENMGILSQIPWSHNVVLIEKLDDIEKLCWYAHKAIENEWSRNMLYPVDESGPT